MQGKKKPKFFWISAMAPLTSVILGTLLVYLTHAEKHGVEVVSPSPHPLSKKNLDTHQPHLFPSLIHARAHTQTHTRTHQQGAHIVQNSPNYDRTGPPV